ncbi:MAG TPA: copper resistance protein CopC [Gemmatimonadaceae bacterium]|nr:copper resistance protein CopC [Gemmatimonadaceae bacterium]
MLFAHAQLLRSSPAANSEVTSPSEIQLWYSEEPDLHFASVQLRKGTQSIELGPIRAVSPNGLRIPIVGPMPPGGYSIAWHVAASDGHATNGTIHFRVKPDSAGAAPPGGGSPPTPAAGASGTSPRRDTAASRRPATNVFVAPGRPVAASTAMRWAEFVALLAVIGAIVFRLVVVPAAKWPDELTADAVDRGRRLAVAFALLFLIATITRAMAESTLLADPTASGLSEIRILVTSTRWGIAWSIGGVGALLAFIGLLVARAGLTGWLIATLGIIAVTVSEALTGHSGASAHLSLAMAADVAHQLGAGGWIGGLAFVAFAGLPATRRLPDPDARYAGSRLVRAYHASALECVVLVVISGVIAAALRLRAVSDLWTTPYGSMLFRKLVFVVVVLAFGFFHWRRVVIHDWDTDTRFRFMRSAAFELVFAAVVVAFTALLVSTQLPL